MLNKVILKNKIYLFLIVTLPVIIAEKTKKSEDTKINIDKKHLAEHFVDLYGIWTDIFSEKEMDLQYFSSHDFDENEKLDGLELFNALNHELVHKEENLGSEQLQKDTENEVDAIFSKYDVDNDGFLDYTEFQRVQKVHEEPSTKVNGTESPIHENT